jgi:O-antigen ligase
MEQTRTKQRYSGERGAVLERLAVFHVGVFGVAATWAFGGQADHVRGLLTAWGLIGIAITVAGVLSPSREEHLVRRLTLNLIPVAVFNLIVLVAASNPSFREVRFGNETMLAAIGDAPRWPSSARPLIAQRLLIEFDAIWISCLNLLLLVRHRRSLRQLTAALTANAVLLASFGTVQKLTNSAGIYFGAVASPQPYFFATFVYHNHWGAYCILIISALVGLAFYAAKTFLGRDPFHSPVFVVFAAILLVTVSIPLSGSRSSTAIMAILLLFVAFHWLWQILRRRRQFNESMALPILATITALGFASAATWFVAGKTIQQRIDVTIGQVEWARNDHFTDARRFVYQDTWKMIRAKPWFGWGMGSFPYAFYLFNTVPAHPKFPLFFHDAHSDWLQALAEHGMVGTTILVSLAAIPLGAAIRRGAVASKFAIYLLLGCGLVLAYAMIEFPFGNYAVVLTWWLCFFTSIRYMELTAGTRWPQTIATLSAQDTNDGRL